MSDPRDQLRQGLHLIAEALAGLIAERERRHTESVPPTLGGAW